MTYPMTREKFRLLAELIHDTNTDWSEKSIWHLVEYFREHFPNFDEIEFIDIIRGIK